LVAIRLLLPRRDTLQGRRDTDGPPQQEFHAELLATHADSSR